MTPCATAPAAGAARRHDRPRRIARRRQLQRVGRPAEQHAGDQLGDRRQPDGFDVRPPDPGFVELQHLPRRIVHQLQPALRIDDDDPFDHAGEDRFHARAIARLLAEAAADFLHRVVERARDAAELVVAEAEARRRQIAAAVALGDAGDEPDAPADPRGKQPGDDGAAERARR